jgi:hypothetical protein
MLRTSGCFFFPFGIAITELRKIFKEFLWGGVKAVSARETDADPKLG